MKRETLILPLNLPRLTDKGAAQLIAVLRELVTAIEYYGLLEVVWVVFGVFHWLFEQ